MRTENATNPPRTSHERREPSRLPEYLLTRHTPKERRKHRRAVRDAARFQPVLATALQRFQKRKGGLPPVLCDAAAKVAAYAGNPLTIPELAKVSGSRILKRAKRCDARLNESLVLLVLLYRLDLNTMCAGSPLKSGGFAHVSMAWIAKVIEDWTGRRMSSSCLARTMRTLKAAGVIATSQARARSADGEWSYAVGLKEVTLQFFAELGLGDALVRDDKHQLAKSETLTFNKIKQRYSQAARQRAPPLHATA